ncbi:MAG TPA: TIGR03013 family XrtA/PEP-CTERM system glycosyltransferase [Candidatus Polarisedimenticolaceae bacterium]|nr:TIGR03013 family XrtA/PEP-CTERM system glycosyltransferase [Candidatus Polarisedimenticolaceae bacterium]
MILNSQVLAALNSQLLLGGGGDAELRGYLLGVGIVFLVSVIGMRRVLLGGEPSLRREIGVMIVLSLCLGGIAVLIALAAFPQYRWSLLPMVLVQGALAIPITMTGWRYVATHFEVLDAYRERVLVVGSGQLARQSGRWLAEHLRSDYRLVGFADEDRARVGEVVVMGARIQTGFDGMSEYCASHVDRILVALDEKRGKLPIRTLMELRLRGVEIEDVTSFFERTTGKINIEGMFPSWLIFSDGFKTSPWRSFRKRAMDITLSLLLLLLAAPAMLLIAIAIRLDSRGPVIYRQRRMGLNGREFDILKFRSMAEDAEKHSGPTWAGDNDSRISRVGRILRKLRLDELPQLINVLRGEMSFVGPRPERAHFVEQLEKQIPYYTLRMVVRPGVTGWAQVCYQYGATVEDALEKLKYDLFYIKNSSVLLDLWIVLKTVRVVTFTSGAR